MFYDIFKRLCEAKDVSVSKAATEIGLSNSTPTKWKKTGATPDSNTLSKIALYFNVTVGYLLGNEKSPSENGEGEKEESVEEIKAAFWGGEKDLSKEDWDEMWEDVETFARFRAEQQRKKRNGVSD